MTTSHMKKTKHNPPPKDEQPVEEVQGSKALREKGVSVGARAEAGTLAGAQWVLPHNQTPIMSWGSVRRNGSLPPGTNSAEPKGSPLSAL